MMCQTADRVGEIICNESYTPRGRGAIIHSLEKGLLVWNEDIADIMYTTLNDGRLQEWCVGNYDHEELIIDTRAKLFAKNLVPEDIRQFLLQLRNRFTNHERLINHLKSAQLSPDASANTLLYIGRDVTPEWMGTLTTFAQFLKTAGVRFNILPQEPLSGYEFYQAGDFDSAAACSKTLATAIKNTGSTHVMVLEADCFRMLTTRTKRFGGDTSGLQVEHFTTTIRRLAEENKLPIKHLAEATTVTFQDPCNLARYCGNTEDPRKILSLLDAELIEMDPAGKLAYCCGGGGLLPVHRPEVAREAAAMRCREAAETKADYLVTACMGCHQMLTHGCRKDDQLAPPQLIHLIDLVARAVAS
ncbi:(Fe-S)-binding protein [Desulfofustis glycolicus]|nr:(Fe-S)-binding protein [Desulfofustis glycolicus]